MRNQYPSRGIADLMAAQGRYGDNRLMHVNDAELQGIASLAPNGLTRNPVTGLPEAFGLKEILPMVAAGVATAAMPVGAPLWASMLAGGAASGITTGAVTGDWQRGLAAGMVGAATAGIGAGAGMAGEKLAEGATTNAIANAAPNAISPVTGGASGLEGLMGAGELLQPPPTALGGFGAETVLGSGGLPPASNLGMPGIDALQAQPTAALAQSSVPASSGPVLNPITGNEVNLTTPEPWYKGEWGQDFGSRMAAPFQDGSGLSKEIMKPANLAPLAIGYGQMAEMDADEQYAKEQDKYMKKNREQQLASERNLAMALGMRQGGIVRMGDGGPTELPPTSPALIAKAIAAQRALIDRDNPVAASKQPYTPFRRLEPIWKFDAEGNPRTYFNSMVPYFDTGKTDFQPYQFPQNPQSYFGEQQYPWGVPDYSKKTAPKDDPATGGGKGKPPGGKEMPVTVTNPDGTITTTYPDGRVVVTDPNGYPISDTNPPTGGGRGKPPGGKILPKASGGLIRSYADGGEVMIDSDMVGQVPIAAGGIANIPPNVPMPMKQADNLAPPMVQPEQGGEPSDQDIQMLAMAITGQAGENADRIIEMFVRKFGPGMFMEARDFILKTMGGENAQTEGMIRGQGGGMDDQVMGTIGGNQPVAVSPGEYIVPADVVSGLGDGSSDAGAQELDQMMNKVRMARGGTTSQPQPFDARSVMPI